MDKSILLGILGLVVGAGLGYVIGGQTHHAAMQSQMPSMNMSQHMEDMNASLRGKTGDEFDKTFLSEMIIHHQGAIDMAKLASDSSKHQEIKDLSTAIINAQTSEIDQMKSWQKKWGYEQ